MDYEKNVCPYDVGQLLTAKNVLDWTIEQEDRAHNNIHNQTILGLIDDANYCSDCINKKGCINCVDGDMKETEHKVEPKFKVGDWITNGEHTWKIVEVKPLDYILQSQDGNIVDDTISYVDEQFHSFTIQDAKDGDVLAWDDSKCIALYKNIDEDSFNSHGFVGHCTGVFETRLSYHDIEGAHPATKEQRDTLMEAMTDAGYEWDTEKKELKKIEQIPYGQGEEIRGKEEKISPKQAQETAIDKLNDANVRKEFKWDSENKIMTIYGVTYEEMKALDDFIYCLRSGTKCPKGVEKTKSEMESEPQAVTFIDSGTMQVIDKLNEVISKLGDVHEVLSKPFQFPYRNYTPPQEPWYKTHGVEKVTHVTCETTNGFNKSEGNESK